MPISIIAGDTTGLFDARGIALDSSRNLYAMGYVQNIGYSVNVYPAGSDGNVPPAATIAGADTGLDDPGGIVLDSGGNLYVLNSYGGPADRGSVTVYRAGSSGDAAPMSTITSNFTGLDFASGVTVDSTGNIYVANESGGAYEKGSIAIYPAGSYATSAPIATIAGDNTGLSNPFGIGLDSSGNIFALNGDNAITLYPAGSSGDVTPSATIDIDTSGKSSPAGIAVDPRGYIYIANEGGADCSSNACFQSSPDSVTVYPPGSDGNAKPVAVISGSNTQLGSPSAIAVDRGGNVYVTNEGPEECKCTTRYCFCYPAGPGSVSVYASGSNGDAAPIATISGSNTGLGYPDEIALDSNRNIYVSNAGGVSGAVTGIKGERVARRKRVPIGGSFGFQNFLVESMSGAPGILIFGAGSRGNVAPTVTISGPYTGLNGPAGIAIGPSPDATGSPEYSH